MSRFSNAFEERESDMLSLYDMKSIRHEVYMTWSLYDMKSIRHEVYMTWSLYDMKSIFQSCMLITWNKFIKKWFFNSFFYALTGKGPNGLGLILVDSNTPTKSNRVVHTITKAKQLLSACVIWMCTVTFDLL